MLTCYAVALRLLLPHRKSISFIILRSNAFVNRCFYRKKKGFFAVLKIQNHVSNPSLNYYGEDGGIFYLLSKGTPYLSPKFFRFAQNLEPRFKSLFKLLWRRWRDLNPRAGCPTYRISNPNPSASWVHLHFSRLYHLGI